MDRVRTLRNVAIVAALAAVVQFLPGAGHVAQALAAALWVVFAAGFGYFAYRYYREHRISVHGLGQRNRILLYGALAVGFFTAAAKSSMWQTGLGELAWFVVIGVCVYVLVAVYRFSRTY